MDSETTTLIHAHLDGRLSAAETERLGELIREDAAVAAAFAEASRLNHMLREAVKEDFRASLHARRMGGAGGRRLRDGEEEEEAPPARSPARRLVRQLAIAACLALFLGGMLALLTTGTLGPQAQSSSAGQRPSSLEARAAGARGPFLQPAAPATADALLRKRLRQFVLPDPAVKDQPAQAALAALAEKWSTLPQIDETWAKTITFTIAPDVLEAWKTAGSEPKVTLEIPGTSLHANLELLAAQADLKVTTSEEGVRLVAAGKSDPGKMVEIRGRVELAVVENLTLTEQEKLRKYFMGDQAKLAKIRAILIEGAVHRDHNRFDEAEDAMNQVLALDPYNTAARRQLERIAAARPHDPLEASLSNTQSGPRADLESVRQPVPEAPVSEQDPEPKARDAMRAELLREVDTESVWPVPLPDDLVADMLQTAETHKAAGREFEAHSIIQFLRQNRPDHPGAAELESKIGVLYYSGPMPGPDFLEEACRPLLKKYATGSLQLTKLTLLKGELERMKAEAARNAPSSDDWLRPASRLKGILSAAGFNTEITEESGYLSWTLDGTRRELRISNALQAAIQDAPKSRPGTVHFLEFPADADLSFAPPGIAPAVAVMNAEQAKAAVGQKGVRAIGFMLETDGAETRVIAENLQRAAEGESVEPRTGWELSIRTSPLEGHRVRCLSGLTLRWAVSGQADEGEVGKVVQEDHQTAELNPLQGHTLCIPAPEKPGETARRFFFVTIPD